MNGRLRGIQKASSGVGKALAKNSQIIHDFAKLNFAFVNKMPFAPQKIERNLITVAADADGIN